MFENLKSKNFDIVALHHAEAIITQDMPQAAIEIEAVLSDFVLPVTELVTGGGGESPGTQRIRNALDQRGWKKRNIAITKTVRWEEDGDEISVSSLSHEIDHVKQFGNCVFALEIEWNNKDPFFDRDLESFKRLHGEGAISAGGLITRGVSLQSQMREILRNFTDRNGIDRIDDLDKYGYAPTRRQRNLIANRYEKTRDFKQAWVEVFVSDKYGEAATHWKKLIDRVSRGVGNPCPLLLIGIPSDVVDHEN
jgi:hypothetical protein